MEKMAGRLLASERLYVYLALLGMQEFCRKPSNFAVLEKHVF